MLLVTAVIIVLVLKGVHGLISPSRVADMSKEATLARIAPVGRLNTGAPMVAEAPAVPAAPAKASARSGEQVYNASCQACHATGAAGAPKLGDKAAWGPRIQQGMDTLVNHALNGFKAMPARGTCGNCSDQEIRSAVEFMLSKSK
ncbi:MAG: cytochrome c5 family protein [Thiohalomonadaceae bacterium]